MFTVEFTKDFEDACVRSFKDNVELHEYLKEYYGFNMVQAFMKDLDAEHGMVDVMGFEYPTSEVLSEVDPDQFCWEYDDWLYTQGGYIWECLFIDGESEMSYGNLIIRRVSLE